MWSKAKALFTKNKPKTDYENVICSNCETQFSGHFCPNCGQALKDYDKPFSFVFYNFAGDFFAFDTRFFRTIVALLFKPGFLSKEYIQGRRVKYAPPFRIFIFVSFVLFLMLQTYTNRGLTTVLDSDLSNTKFGLDSTSLGAVDSLLNLAQADMDSTEVAVVDSVLTNYGVVIDTTNGEVNLDFIANLAAFRDTRDLRNGLSKYAVILEKKLENEQEPKERASIIKQIRVCRSPEQVMAQILKYISWAFFILLPLFAIVLKLVFIRRKQNYMRHLIFSIHIHSFIFVVLILVVGIHMVTSKNIELLTSLLILTIPVYVVIAMKKFYEQSIGKTIAKFIVVSFSYNIIFLIVILTAALNALYLL